MADERPPATGDVDVERVLDALESDAARRLLGHLDTPRTAQDLARRSDVPLSTVYRSVERLADAGLVRTRTEIRFDGTHPTRYELAVDSVTIRIADDGSLTVDLAPDGREPGDADGVPSTRPGR